ncbi:MAG: metallophosphoesterase family protein [Verrucomicrobiales bacterium]|nr:metallophosphoesterase family protein [Verrucomicrobiales bacterium]
MPGPLSKLALLAIFPLAIHLPAQADSSTRSATDKYRVVWTGDPTSEAVIAWNQVEGSPGVVHFGEKDEGRNAGKYPEKQKIDHSNDFDGMNNCFVRLEDLKPDTTYYFCIEDEKGVSPRFYFTTAPDKAKTFTFVAGGDSRNFRDVRIAANLTAAKLRPLFIAFTGDMINKDNAMEWQEWLDDWQNTTTKDGRMIPLLPHRGNHESRPASVPSLFDTPEHVYYAFDIGDEQLRYYVLNSQIPASGKQKKWLEKDLKKHAKNRTHLVAGYHKPMRPHVSAKSEGENPMHWAETFYQFGLDLALESDSHVMKRTLPLKPDPRGDEGFSAAPKDPKATVFIGEGCWGAPLRKADDAKSWTIATESFNGIDWIEVSPEKMQIKTVRVKKPSSIQPVTSDNSFETPEGVILWEPKGGAVLEIPAD